MRTAIKLVLGACGAMLVAVIGLIGSSGAVAQSGPADQRVIVVLRDQLPALPASPGHEAARAAAVRGAQAQLVAQLRSSGARDLQRYTLLDALSATVSRAEATRLQASSSVGAVVPDQIIHLAPPIAPGPVRKGAHGHAAAASKLCSSRRPQLNPQALETIRADSDVKGARTARSLGLTGAGVTVGFIADGLDINNREFIRRDGRHVIVDFKDFTGEGTAVPTGGGEAFGDASSIAAQGRSTYNVAGYGPDAVKGKCLIRVEGVAPGARVVALDIFGAEDAGYSSSLLRAIDYAVSVDHVNVLNESLGSNPYPDDPAGLDLVKAANDAAVAAGATVTVSTGDAGVTSTIGSPSSDPKVLAVGASTTHRLYLQAGYGGAQFPGVRGYTDDNISPFSSSGFEQSGRTIDLVAPGEDGWAACSTDVNAYGDCTDFAGNPTSLLDFGGTSESAPITAGAAALVIQAYRRTHHGSTPSPGLVKQLIDSTADDIGAPADQQGAGRLDVLQAVLAAESYRAQRRVGATLLQSAPQLNAIAAAGTRQTLSETITDNGSRSQRITLRGRALGPYRTIATRTVTLDDVNSPKTTDFVGNPSNVQSITFTVPAGQNRLNAAIAFAGVSPGDPTSRVRLTLVDPAHALAAYSVPQGTGNYGDVQLTNPRPGTWTAYVWARTAAIGGTTGPVRFGAAVARYTRFGTVTPSRLTLRPGHSARVGLRVTTPAHPGDVAGAIVMSASGETTTVPVTLRSRVPTGHASFTGVLTGGNGDTPVTGQTFYYQLRLPSSEPELNASVSLADNPDNPFTAFLVNPSGEALATASNTLPDDASPGGTAQVRGAQLHVLAPAAGTWTLIVAFAPQVSGSAITEPFTVKTDESLAPASVAGLPDTIDAELPAGAPQSIVVTVRNTGSSPAAYFIDPRLPSSSVMNLAPLNGASTTAPLNAGENLPAFIVPTHTTQITARALTSGPTPIEFDSSSPAGDPDIASTVGSSVLATHAARPVAQGAWSIAPTVAGAFGAAGVPPEPVTTSMTAVANAFDPTLTSPTGDLWEAAAGEQPLKAVAPIVVEPGQTAAIPVTLTPVGASGTSVSGTLFLDAANADLFGGLTSPGGDEVAAFPYAYSIK